MNFFLKTCSPRVNLCWRTKLSIDQVWLNHERVFIHLLLDEFLGDSGFSSTQILEIAQIPSLLSLLSWWPLSPLYEVVSDIPIWLIMCSLHEWYVFNVRLHSVLLLNWHHVFALNFRSGCQLFYQCLRLLLYQERSLLNKEHPLTLRRGAEPRCVRRWLGFEILFVLRVYGLRESHRRFERACGLLWVFSSCHVISEHGGATFDVNFLVNPCDGDLFAWQGAVGKCGNARIISALHVFADYIFRLLEFLQYSCCLLLVAEACGLGPHACGCSGGLKAVV